MLRQLDLTGGKAADGDAGETGAGDASGDASDDEAWPFDEEMRSFDNIELDGVQVSCGAGWMVVPLCDFLFLLMGALMM